MTEVPAGCSAKKSSRRVAVVEGIMNGLMSEAMYKVIGSGRSETTVASYMHQTLLEALRGVYRRLDPDAGPELLDRWSRAALLWEGDVNTTINNIQFLGAQHRPDFVVRMDGICVALEVKRGENGASVRDALGQCLVYASRFEFTCCVFVDTSRDKKVRHAYEHGPREQFLLDQLWKGFNIRFGVV